MREGQATGSSITPTAGWRQGHRCPLTYPNTSGDYGTSPESFLDTYHAERHPIGSRELRLTLVQTALGCSDDCTEALCESLSEFLRMDAPRTRFGAMVSGRDIDCDLGEGHPQLGALDLVELGGDGVVPEATGGSSCHPSALLKLHIYGYFNRI